MSKNRSIQETMEKNGWVFEDFYCHKMVKEKELDIEFCIGDYCVGIHDKSKWLIEPKIRCKSFLEALSTAHKLEEKYLKN